MDLPEWRGGARTHSRAKRGVEFGRSIHKSTEAILRPLVIAVMIFIDDE